MRLHYEGEERIRAGREAVRRFLLDPKAVGACLPDVESVEPKDGTAFLATVRVGVGPVRGLFRLDARLAATEADRFRIDLLGSGMGSGLQVESRVELAAGSDEGETVLRWQADATVSGPLAGVGGRLLEGQARKTVERLFGAVRERLEAASGEAEAAGGGDPA